MKPNYESEICRAESFGLLSAERRSPYSIGQDKLSQSIVLLCAFFFFLFSCGSPEEKNVVIPADILLKEKMAEVITDIHLAEATANMKTLPDSASTEKINFGKIFEKHKITKEQYEKSLTFFIDNPELLNEVYEKVLNELSKMQADAGKQ